MMPAAQLKAADTSVDGDLHVTGEMDYGTTVLDTQSQAAVYQLYDENGTAYTVRFRTAKDSSATVWEQNAAAPKKKMELDKDNILKLYDPENPTGAPTVLLDPATGSVEVKGTVKFTGGSQPSSISVDSNGKLLYSGPVVFSSQVILQSGATVAAGQTIQFGSGVSAALNESKVAYLDGTLTNLGYRSDGVTGTLIKKIPFSGQVTITDIKRLNGYEYIAGFATGPCMFSSTFLGQVNAPVDGATVAFIAKYQSNPNGSSIFKWVRTLNTSIGASTSFKKLAVDSGENIIVVGAFSGTTTNLPTNVTSLGSSPNAVVIKYNSSGTVQWSKVVAGNLTQDLSDVAVDSLGHVVAVGSFNGTTSTLDGYNITSAGKINGFAVKLDGSVGSVLWSKVVGGNVESNTLLAVAVDAADNIITGGSFYRAVTTLESDFNFSFPGARAAILLKTNSGGVTQWVKHFSTGGSSRVFAIAIQSNGDVLAGGNLHGSTTDMGSNDIVGAGQYDGWIGKFASTDGAIQWTRAIGGTGDDQVNSLATDSSGNLYVGGTALSALTNLGSFNTTSGGGYQITLDGSGAIQRLNKVSDSYSASVLSLSYENGSLSVAGTSSAPFSIGNTKALAGSYALTWPVGTLVTPVPSAPASFAWSNGLAPGSSSVALGGFSFAEGVYSTALGSGNAVGAYSFASGNSSQAQGSNSIALGSLNMATSSSSLAVGYGNSAANSNSTALGGYNKSLGKFSVTLGNYATAQGMYTVVLGTNNVPQGNSISWLVTDDLFVIGNGTSTSNQSNAFAIHKNGNTRIAGQLEAKGVIRCAKAGDLDMGAFTDGANPADATNGLNAGLRYATE